MHLYFVTCHVVCAKNSLTHSTSSQSFRLLGSIVLLVSQFDFVMLGFYE